MLTQSRDSSTTDRDHSSDGQSRTSLREHQSGCDQSHATEQCPTQRTRLRKRHSFSPSKVSDGRGTMGKQSQPVLTPKSALQTWADSLRATTSLFYPRLGVPDLPSTDNHQKTNTASSSSPASKKPAQFSLRQSALGACRRQSSPIPIPTSTPPVLPALALNPGPLFSQRCAALGLPPQTARPAEISFLEAATPANPALVCDLNEHLDQSRRKHGKTCPPPLSPMPGSDLPLENPFEDAMPPHETQQALLRDYAKPFRRRESSSSSVVGPGLADILPSDVMKHETEIPNPEQTLKGNPSGNMGYRSSIVFASPAWEKTVTELVKAKYAAAGGSLTGPLCHSRDLNQATTEASQSEHEMQGSHVNESLQNTGHQLWDTPQSLLSENDWNYIERSGARGGHSSSRDASRGQSTSASASFESTVSASCGRTPAMRSGITPSSSPTILRGPKVDVCKTACHCNQSDRMESAVDLPPLAPQNDGVDEDGDNYRSASSETLLFSEKQSFLSRRDSIHSGPHLWTYQNVNPDEFNTKPPGATPKSGSKFLPQDALIPGRVTTLDHIPNLLAQRASSSLTVIGNGYLLRKPGCMGFHSQTRLQNKSCRALLQSILLTPV